MLDSRLVESIKLLTPTEQSEFDSFLDSRFFQREFSVQQLKQFLAIIVEVLSDPGKKELSKEIVHAKVFAPKEFAENRVDRIMFELNRLIKTFILVKHYLREENEVQQTLDWNDLQLYHSNAGSLEKQFKKINKLLNDKNMACTRVYQEKFLVTKQNYALQATFNKNKSDLGIQQTIESLDLFYFAERSELINALLLQKRSTAFVIPEILENSINAIPVPEYYTNQSPLLLISTKIHSLLAEAQPKVAGFQELVALLNQHQDYLHPEALTGFYAYLRNYCTILIDSGNAEFDVLLHEIQKDNLPRGYFYYDGKILPNSFLSITQQAIRAHNIPWAKEFVQNHKDKIIGENETHDFFNMNLALCHFAEQKYEETLETIPFGSTYSYYHLMARRLELKAYYELGSEILPSKIDAFKMFINRTGNKSLSKPLAEMLTNFGNFVHQLSLSIPGDKKRSEQLTKRIKSKKLVGERTWLLEKAEQLANKKL
jgi:hypothetical protein